jgi:spore maturation protein CgeB
MRIALVADELTTASLHGEPGLEVVTLTPWNYWWKLRLARPNFLLVESAWQGHRNSWKYKIASYPDHPDRSNAALVQLVNCARDLGIPTVFWNKEDGVHFERFIASASLFDFIFTVDENCIERYRLRVGSHVRVETLMFAVQPAVHHPASEKPHIARACFVGSYGLHIHDRRRRWQDMMFRGAQPLGVTCYDRNSDRKSSNFRFPPLPWLDVKASVPHSQTADIFRQYVASLNVNTVEDSRTMFSRRLVEIIACGGLAVTNPGPSIDQHFREFCEVVHDEEECRALFDRLAQDGLTKRDRDRALAGAEYVLRHHTWAHRVQEIWRVIQ